jgi:hypothetical protein
MSARAWAPDRASPATWWPRVGWWALALSTACCSSPLDPERGAASASGSGHGAAPPAGPSLTWPEPPPRPSAAATLTAAVEPPPPPSSSALRRERSSSETRPAHRLALSPDGARFVALVGDVLGSGPGPVLVHGDTATLGSKPVARRLDGLVRGLAIADDGALALGLVDALVLLEGGRERVVSDVDTGLFAFDARGRPRPRHARGAPSARARRGSPDGGGAPRPRRRPSRWRRARGRSCRCEATRPSPRSPARARPPS